MMLNPSNETIKEVEEEEKGVGTRRRKRRNYMSVYLQEVEKVGCEVHRWIGSTENTRLVGVDDSMWEWNHVPMAYMYRMYMDRRVRREQER